MGPEFTVVIAFLFLALFFLCVARHCPRVCICGHACCVALPALYILILSAGQWCKKAHIFLFAVRWCEKGTSCWSLCANPSTLPSVTMPCWWAAALFHLDLSHCGYDLFPKHRADAPVPYSTRCSLPSKGCWCSCSPHTPTVGKRHSELPQSIKSLQGHSGPLEVNSGSSLWWCRHSGPLSPRASLNLTASPQPGVYCSASFMLSGN